MVVDENSSLTSLLFAGDYYPVTSKVLPSITQRCRVIANLECALRGNQTTPNKAYSVTVSEDVVTNLCSSGFVALNVANNHVLDSGNDAFREMITRLESQEQLVVYGTAERPFASLKMGKDHCAVIGCLERCRARGADLFREEDVEALVRSLRHRFDWIFVTPHWGKYSELGHFPSPQQIARARSWIEAGAHAVLGHHPHTVQGRTILDGRPVYYSLGNLYFPHVQSKAYQATRFGLAVEIGIEACTHRFTWREHYLWHTDVGTYEVGEPEQSEWARFLDQLSQPLSMNWTWSKWARIAGSVYLRQAAESWQHRLARNGWVRTLPLMLAWNVLPITLLLRIGRLFPNRELLSPIERRFG